MYICTVFLEDFLQGLSCDVPMMLAVSGALYLGFRDASNCTHDNENFRYPMGQLVVYSKAGLQYLSNGFRLAQ